MGATSSAKRFFEAAYEIDAARGESVKTLLGEDGILHVHVVKVPPAYLPHVTMSVAFDSDQ